MNILQSLETWVSAQNAVLEAKAVQLAINIKHDVQVAESDISAVLAYMTAHLPQVVGFLGQVSSMIAILAGIPGVNTAAAAGAVTAALKVTSDAGAALAAYNADIAAGKSQAIALADLVAAFMEAKTAASSAASATIAITPAKS
jgi:hypothetical protein